MAVIIVGAKVAAKVIADCTAELDQVVGDQQLKPKLAIVQVGKQDDWNSYLASEIKKWSEDKIDASFHLLDNSASINDIKDAINQFNDDSSADGIYVQLAQMSRTARETMEIYDQVLASKDVAGLTSINRGRLMCGDTSSNEVACIPHCCLEIVSSATEDANYACGKRVVIVSNRSEVSLPIAALFMRHHANTVICDLQTPNLKDQCKQADILIVQTDMPKHITGDWLKPGVLIIDFGIYVQQRTIGGVTTCGDVHFDSASEKAGFLTAVPDGVVSVFAAMLIKNTMHQALLKAISRDTPGRWNIQYNKLKISSPVPSDVDISRSQKPRSIVNLAQEVGILPHELELYGETKAKVSLKILNRLEARKNGKYIVVVGITPTPFGEGKSTAVFGLVQALGAHERKNAIACVRQPSQGPTFGMKGGAAGGGYAQVIPMDEFNLHLTGDTHAIVAANNLLAAAIDARLFHESTQRDAALFNRLVPADKNGERRATKGQKRRLARLGISAGDDLSELTDDQRRRFARLNMNPETITWTRVVDTNDRFLRVVEVGHGPLEKGHVRRAQFDIAVASELMAILALSTSLTDMYERIANIVVANDMDGNPITADDIGVTGALTLLMKDTIRPTMMQTLEGTPVFIHAGPFANIAHGQSSILADKLALKLVGQDGFVVTEAGFGADIGMEKFADIKCRYSHLKLNAAIIIATVRALKMHGGGATLVPDAPYSAEYLNENLELVEKGCDSNLRKQVEIVAKFGAPIIVCINHFETDTQKELDLIVSKSLSFGAGSAVVSRHWSRGGEGARQLAKAVIETCKKPTEFRFLYDLYQPLESKIETIAKEIYGASSVDYSPLAKQKLELYERQGFGHLPICMAKTQFSLTDNPSRKGAPTDFVLTIQDVRASVGAGFIYPLCGTIQTMPGLGTRPRFIDIDLDPDTEIIVGF